MMDKGESKSKTSEETRRYIEDGGWPTEPIGGVLLLYLITPGEWRAMSILERNAALMRGDAKFFQIADPEWAATLAKFSEQPDREPILYSSWIREDGK